MSSSSNTSDTILYVQICDRNDQVTIEGPFVVSDDPSAVIEWACNLYNISKSRRESATDLYKEGRETTIPFDNRRYPVRLVRERNKAVADAIINLKDHPQPTTLHLHRVSQPVISGPPNHLNNAPVYVTPGASLFNVGWGYCRTGPGG